MNGSGGWDVGCGPAAPFLLCDPPEKLELPRLCRNVADHSYPVRRAGRAMVDHVQMALRATGCTIICRMRLGCTMPPSAWKCRLGNAGLRVFIQPLTSCQRTMTILDSRTGTDRWPGA